MLFYFRSDHMVYSNKLKNYLTELKKRNNLDCWYIVKQGTNFEDDVRAINVLLRYQASVQKNQKVKIKEFFEDNSNSIIHKRYNYRILSNTYNLGLLTNDKTGYINAKTTNIYELIRLYASFKDEIPYYSQDQLRLIKNMQIEKLFVSNRYDNPSKIKTNLNGSKIRDFRLFPIPILYKIMLALYEKGITTITKLQFSVFISTIKNYDEIDDVISYIEEISDDDNTFIQEMKSRGLKDYFDSRVWNFITQLSSIVSIGKNKNNAICLNKNYIDSLKNKVKTFWNNLDSYKKITNDEYDKLLTYNVELWDWCNIKDIPPLKEIDEDDRLSDGDNTIYYGAPGTGKSYKVSELIKEDYPEYSEKNESKYVFRVTLHPEYTYSDFVGQVLPYTNGDKVSYEFIPNIFTIALKQAYENPTKKVYLVLEEMSRANVAAVFGDLFQLLDRDHGSSEYSINNTDIANVVYQNPTHPVAIPSNMSIIGTVNTSDQNVFVMDTAFKRRFNWKYISTNEGVKNNINFINPEIKIDNKVGNVDWKTLYQALNEFIVENLNLSEDKQIGPYFIKFEDGDPKKAHDLVKDKLLQYLWEDINSAAYNTSDSLFREKKDVPSFSTLYEKFDEGIPVFSESFLTTLGANNESVEDKN